VIPLLSPALTIQHSVESCSRRARKSIWMGI
jgi:hypothetical protein